MSGPSKSLTYSFWTLAFNSKTENPNMQQRKRLLINWSVQGPLLIRLIVHLVTYSAATLSLVILCWMYQRRAIESVLGPNAEPLNLFWYRFLPIVGCCLAVLPFVLYDMLKITNRIAGPLFRFEEAMQQFEETGVLPKAHLRENDLLTDFCGRYNKFVGEMHERYPDCRPADEVLQDIFGVSNAVQSVGEPATA